MKRRWMLVVSSLLGACQVAEGTGQTRQHVEVNDCTPGGNYCDAQMPPVPFWNGKEQPPQSGPTARVVVWEVQAGEWVGILADPDLGQVTWARRVLTDKLGPFIAIIGLTKAVDISRPPPPPPPPDGGDWLKWAAPVALELAKRANELPFEASAAYSGGCPGEPPEPPKF